MCCLGIFKRVVPFLITFAAGLFIASFFITIAAPSFPASRRQSKFREMRQVRMEVEELRRERDRLKVEIETLRSERNVTVQATEPLADIDVYAVPPPPPVPTIKLKKTVEVR